MYTCAICNAQCDFAYDLYDLPDGVKPAAEVEGQILCWDCATQLRERKRVQGCKVCGSRKNLDPSGFCERCGDEVDGLCCKCDAPATHMYTEWIGGESYVSVLGSVVHTRKTPVQRYVCARHAEGRDAVPIPDVWQQCIKCGATIPRSRGRRRVLGVGTFEYTLNVSYICADCAQQLISPDWTWERGVVHGSYYVSRRRKEQPQDPKVQQMLLDELREYISVWGELPDERKPEK